MCKAMKIKEYLRMGGIDWSFGKMLVFAFFVLICPPAWFYFSLPLNSRIGRAPIIKFVCHIGFFFSILLDIMKYFTF